MNNTIFRRDVCKLAFLLFTFPSACAVSGNPIGKGALPPDDALNLCLPVRNTAQELSPFAYGIDGHQWLTMRIVLAATGDYRLAHGLGYYAQYPDIDTDYEAIRRAVNITDPAWRTSVMDHLHSLHGGDNDAINVRREKIFAELMYWNGKEPREIWEVGLVIHALGDSYAHTKGKMGSADEKAYGIPFGHLWDSIAGKDPDLIRNQKKKAIKYSTQVYLALAEDPDNTTPEFDALLEDINRCKDDSCEFIGGFYPSREEQESGEVIVGSFTECMNLNARKITKREILTITDSIVRPVASNHPAET